MREIEPGLVVSSQGTMDKFDGHGVVGARAASVAGRFATYDMAQLSKIEAAVRIQAFETVEFLRKNAPGFENAYILFMSPFLGARGGPCIEGEHVLTPKETSSSCKFDDVILSVAPRVKYKTGHVEPAFEAPYRMLLPKKIDGLLASGRSASYIRRGHDPSFRRRPIAMLIGQVAGTAAALSVKFNATPKTLDIMTLQKQLVQDGIYLGDERRLRELELEQ